MNEELRYFRTNRLILDLNYVLWIYHDTLPVMEGKVSSGSYKVALTGGAMVTVFTCKDLINQFVEYKGITEEETKE